VRAPTCVHRPSATIGPVRALHATECTRHRPHTEQALHTACPKDADAQQGQGPESKESGAPREDRHGAPSSSTCRREQHRQRKHTRHRHGHCKTPHLHNTTGTHTQCTPVTPRPQHPGARLSTDRCGSWRASSNAAHRPHKHASTAATHRQAPHWAHAHAPVSRASVSSV
jgi:hypothetical protein